jgi:putative salt-induced outer membrane protein YdiY
MFRSLFFAVLAVAFPFMMLSAAYAAEGDTPGWYFDADLGGVWTAGNSESNTLGVGAKLQRVWPQTTLTFRGAATQTQSTLITRQAVGTPTDFQIDENKQTEKTAEFYNAMGGVKHTLGPHFFAFGGVDWMRNRFAGIDDRTLIAAGAGNTWKDTDKTKFNTYYSVTYTFQTDVVENPFVKSDFPGLQLGYAYETDVSSSTRFESALVADWNLDDTEDVRVDWYNSLPVSISSKLELKPTLRLLWRNTPSLTEVPLYDTNGTDTGTTVTTPLNKLDSIFTLALVVKLGPSPEAD